MARLSDVSTRHPALGTPEEAALWRAVCANEALLAAASACDPADVAKVAQLRRKWPAPEVRVALELMLARGKAAKKLPAAWAGRLIADPQGVEQASSWAVAKWKAGRFAKVAQASACGNSIPQAEACVTFDLCCGAGFDALAFADAGFTVEACDLNPVRAFMAEQNVGLLHWTEGGSPSTNEACLVPRGQAALGPVVRCADAADYATKPLPPHFLHLDPARRDGAGRIFTLEDYLPPPSVWDPLLRQAAGGCVKLAPGVPHAALADFADTLGVPWSSSFVSEDGWLVQSLLWTGALAQSAPREAVLIAGDQVHTLQGEAGAPPMWYGEAPAFLFEADDAVERSQLLGALAKAHDLSELHAGLGLLAGETRADSPWLKPFAVLSSFAWDEKKARVALQEHGAGLVEVKTRGQACDPNALEKKLRGEGKERLTLFVLRLGGSLRGFVTKRGG